MVVGDQVDEALAEVEKATKKPAAEPKPAPTKRAGSGLAKSGKNYAAYAPHKFKRHPAARVVNWGLDQAFEPLPDNVDSARIHAVGESLTAAVYYGAGLPPWSESQGDGHPYAVAASNVMGYGGAKAARTPWFKAAFAEAKKMLKRKPRA